MNTALAFDPALLSLSVIVPAYNEEATIAVILEKICAVPLGRPLEIIVVNDGSTDETLQRVQSFLDTHPHVDLKLFSKPNQGKGSAVKMGIENASGGIVLIQDADLEYDPQDYRQILQKIDAGALVVYGSRNIRRTTTNHSSSLFYWGGLLVTLCTNLLFGSRLTDEATCYKCFRKEVFLQAQFSRLGFGWEPEITARILKRGIPIEEVAISYTPRGLDEGKKISWKDGLKALWILCYERFRQ